MKKIFTVLASAALVLAAPSCLKPEQSESGGKDAVKLTVQLNMPESEAEIDIRTIDVKIQSKTLPIAFKANPDASGKVEFNVAPDKYDIIASKYFETTRISVNGLCNEFLLTEKGIVGQDGGVSKPEISINLSVALPSPIVIREFFYHGSTTLEGGVGYQKDQYIEIYNNTGLGGRTYYLDSLCIAAIYPYNSTTQNNAWLNADTLALAQIYWMIPGTGKTYPLQPGESAVIACKAAVDHSGRATSGLHLEKAHFGCYDEILSGHEKSAGVPSLECNMVGQGTAWALSIHSPALVLFRPEMGVDAYRQDAEHWEKYEPGKSAGTKYWYIAKEWIIDGVECYDTPVGALKRLPASIDASYACMTSPHYSGKCISRRKLDIASDGGIAVYADTNNSLEDFLTDQVLSPRLKQ